MASAVAPAQFVAPKVSVCELVEFNNGQETEWHPGFVTYIGGGGVLEITALVTEGRDQFDDAAALARIIVRTPCRHVDDPVTLTEDWRKYTVGSESGGLWRKHKTTVVDAGDIGQMLGVIESLQDRIEVLEALATPPAARKNKSASNE